MKNFVKGWNENYSLEDTKNLAYWERNMLALALAQAVNESESNYNFMTDENEQQLPCGWYIHGEWDGWSRVISISDGAYTFHVPDDFDLGNLPQIEPNWDGHTTEEKWTNLMEYLGCKVDAQKGE